MAAIEPPGAIAAVFAACAALQVAPASAQSTGEEERVSFRVHDYDESRFAGEHIGDAQRYHVKTAQAGLALTLRGGFVLDVTALGESMSGSSPWFVLPDAQGRPVQVLSGASIVDHRRELAVAIGSPSTAAVRHLLRAQYSGEDDYHAVAAGYEYSRVLAAQRTLALGFSASDDRLDPTDATLYDRVDHADKRSAGVFVALTQVLDRNRQLQVGVNGEFADGYLSDPYKQVLIGRRLQRDARPDQRRQGALLLRYRQALHDGQAALHLDYRLSRDDWGVRAHALEATWIGEFGNGFELGPSLRYYSQTAARFYAPFLAAPRRDGHASSDYRLGQFGAFSVGLTLTKRFGDYTLRLGAERYRSATDYALGGSDAAVPGLTDFSRISVGIDWAF